MATRPRLPKTNIEMQRWSAALGDEISTWPNVTSRPMFGMIAFYRGKNIFAALPRTRAMNTPSSLMVKLPPPKHKRLKAGRGPGAGWVTFEMTSEADLTEALRCLERAYERAGAHVTYSAAYLIAATNRGAVARQQELRLEREHFVDRIHVIKRPAVVCPAAYTGSETTRKSCRPQMLPADVESTP